MSPAELALGGLLIVVVVAILIGFSEMNTRHHVPDEEELNYSHEEDVHPDSLDR
ncbi:MAG TPA: hypothetical protein VLI04_16405 [Nocardioidaceae bacterium]|nr:hypothetical protein [Nocardioidaceae bacterium]